MSRPPASVTTAKATTSDVPVYLDAIGKTVPIQMVSIVPQVGGKVLRVNVEDGAFVSKDSKQPLFEIDPAPFEAAVASAEATLAQNKAELQLANVEFARVEELRPQNVISQVEYEQKKAARDVAAAKVKAAEAALEMARLDLSYTKIYSPIDGRAGEVWVDAGNIVKENDGQLLVIQQLDPIYAEFTVTENDLGTVRKFMAARGMEVGQEHNLGLKALVDVPGDSARVLTALGKPPPSTAPATQRATQPGPREGVVTFLDNSVQSGTGTIKVRATVPNADGYFWPGQFVNVRLVLTTKQDAVLIPAMAQQIGQQGPYVYIVKQGEVQDPQTGQTTAATVAELRPITPGQRQGDMLVVESGVNPDEMVIVTGQMLVSPGGPVNVVGGEQTAQAAHTADGAAGPH